MSEHSMASIPPPSPLNFSDDNKKIDLNSVHELIAIINRHMHAILHSAQSLKSLKSRCISSLNIQAQEFFEFSEHTVISNLFYGIEITTAAAHQSVTMEDETITLEKSEKMLQIPASLDENGVTLGISNAYLICVSYFYLSIVESLRKNEWQMAVHFLQAVLVSPGHVAKQFAPGICHSFLPLFLSGKKDEKSFRIDRFMMSDFNDDDGDEMVDCVMRWIARRYKPWLMYYQIMSSGDFRQGNRRNRVYLLNDHQSQNKFQSSCENITGLGTNHDKMHSQEHDSVPRTRSSKIKRLKDILTESDSQPDTPIYQRAVDETKVLNCISRSFSTSFCGTDISALGLEKMDQYLDDYTDEEDKLDYEVPRPFHHKSSLRMKKSLSCHIKHEEKFILEQNGVLEKIISNLCFTQELLEHDEEDYMVEMKMIYVILNSKPGLKYSLLKDMILDQLVTAISTSNEQRVVRTSMAILTTIVIENRPVIEDIKKKGLQLYDLATALKRNVHEAAILIYLINPSPVEIKTLEILPCLVEVVCKTSKSSYKVELTSLVITPQAASLMIIEVLVSAFDIETNSIHLAAISSPRVLSGLVQVPRKNNLEELISLAAILVKCMRFDGKCRKYISEFTPVAPFVSLVWSNQKRTTSIALEFFNELLRIPRSSALVLLNQIQKHGCVDNLCALYLLTQNSEPEYRLLAANLLLQLEVLEDKSAKCIYREEATEALLESLTCQESPATQALSAFILANLGGTFSWTGEPYTMAWLVKKTGLTWGYHWNLIKNFDFLDQSLQDAGIDSWCSKNAQRILIHGTSVFHALEKGLMSKLKRVSRDCLIATAWLGCELVKGPEELRHAACEIVLHSIEQYVHPGFELEERLLACLCIYNYTSGRGMKKIVNLSEGVRESLRRLSNVTWMAEELLKVADYFQPNKWRISCVHSQILEVGNKSSGSVTALIYYKGQLYSGYADGSIKVWDINGQTATLVHEIKAHKKAVTCFALYEPGNCLLSGSADKTIKMWQMLQRTLECIEAIPTKESIRSVDSWGELIFMTTQSYKLKVIDASRKTKDVFKNKRVKCIKVSQGKVYAGCTDSSIQELMIANNRHQEIKGPSTSWIQSKPISSISIYKDWLCSASLTVEGSKTKEWRRSNKPQISIMPEKGASIIAMEVVEDFVYLNCSTSMNSLQIWLRGTQHKVGRLSGGSKITSILSANDMILCGTEKGVIKGWIPL